MAFLYINSKGTAWRKHSYSAGNDYDSSPVKYFLRRVMGWKERDNKARLRFGRALEEAIQFHHENGFGGVENFLERWAKHEKDDTLIYTKTEKDWKQLNRIGYEMMKLYLIKQPKLPIPLGGRSLFQKEYSREVFPGDPNYGEIDDAGKIDIIAMNDPNHPMLPKVDWDSSKGILRSLIVDIKTSGVDFPDIPGVAAFDKQLRRYAWLSGISDVAILWFKKCGPGLQKGSSATLLEDTGEEFFAAGDEVVVAANEDEGVYIVRDDFFIEQMSDYQGYSNGRLDTSKAGKTRKSEWLEDNAVLVQPDVLTRQRIQFNVGRVTSESAEEAGMIAARQIIEIVNAWKNKKWPNTFGVRFPNDDTRDPYFRAFVLKDKMFKDQNFIQSDEASLNDLFTDEDTEATE